MPAVPMSLLFWVLCIVVVHSAAERQSCIEMVDDEDTINALHFSATCSNSTAFLTWRDTKNHGTSLSLITIEYQCYNISSGEAVTDTVNVELLSERHNYNVNITNEEFGDEDVYCTFRGCAEVEYFFFTVTMWNEHAVNCSYEDDETGTLQSTYSSITSEVISSSLTSTVLMDSQSQILNSKSESKSLLVSASRSDLTTTSSIPSSASTIAITTSMPPFKSAPSKTSNDSAEMAVVLIGVLVALFGVVGLLVLLIVCVSYRRWLMKTTSVQYEYEVKQEFSNPIRSVSFYSIDNISTTGSSITVLHSLSIKHTQNYEDSDRSNAHSDDTSGINKAVNFEKFTFNEKQPGGPTIKVDDDDELDSTSDCSTVALQSPATTKEMLLTGEQKCCSSESASDERTASVDIDGYLGSDVRSQAVITNNNVSAAPNQSSSSHLEQTGNSVFSDYIPQDPSNTSITRQSQQHPSYDNASDSAYVSGTSMSSGTNTGYLMANFSKTFENLETKESFEDRSELNNTSDLQLSSEMQGFCHDPKLEPTLHDSTPSGHHIQIEKCNASSDYVSDTAMEEYANACDDQVYIKATESEVAAYKCSPPKHILCDSRDRDVEGDYVSGELKYESYTDNNHGDVCIDLCESFDLPSKSCYLSTAVPGTMEMLTQKQQQQPNWESGGDYIVTMTPVSLNPEHSNQILDGHQQNVGPEHLELDLCEEMHIDSQNQLSTLSSTNNNHKYSTLQAKPTEQTLHTPYIQSNIFSQNSSYLSENPATEEILTIKNELKTAVDGSYLPSFHSKFVESCDVTNLVSKQEVDLPTTDGLPSDNQSTASYPLNFMVSSLRQDGYI